MKLDKIEETIDSIKEYSINILSSLDELNNKKEFMTHEQKVILNYTLLALTTKMRIFFFFNTLNTSKVMAKKRQEQEEKYLIDANNNNMEFSTLLENYIKTSNKENLNKIESYIESMNKKHTPIAEKF